MKNSNENILEIINCSACYSTSRGELKAVNEVSFNIKKEEIVGIAGESGCGKSTLIKILYGFIKPPLRIISGNINLYLKEKSLNISLKNYEELKLFRWKYISYIPQASMSMLNPVTTIRQQFKELIDQYSNKDNIGEVERRIIAYIEEFGLPRKVLDSYPHQLSGGMRQRIVIIMATLFHPSITYADEPTTGLDVVVQRGILQMLSRISREFKMTLVLVSHDMGVHYQITDRVIIMYAGKVVEISPTAELFYNPLHPYTSLLIASLPEIGNKGKKEGVSGHPPDFLNLPSGCTFLPRCYYSKEVCRFEEPKLLEVGSNHFVACHLY